MKAASGAGLKGRKGWLGAHPERCGTHHPGAPDGPLAEG
jgi:hypothetical protein